MEYLIYQKILIDSVAVRLACADVDPLDCHLAAGFDDSTVKLWQINQSSMKGRKPYASHLRRMCTWNLDYDCLDLSSTDDDEDEDDADDKADHQERLARRRHKRGGNEERRSVAQDEDNGEHLL